MKVKERIALLEKANRELTREIKEKKSELEMLQARNMDLEAENIKLENTCRELEEFTNTVSHDLRAPLHGIFNFVSIVLEDHSRTMDSEGIRMMEAIMAICRGQEKQIEDMLNYSRISRHELKQEKVPCIQAIECALTALQEAIERNGINVRIIHPLPVFHGDSAMLCTVFQNLISNAIKFNDHEGPDIKVEIGGELPLNSPSNSMGKSSWVEVPVREISTPPHNEKISRNSDLTPCHEKISRDNALTQCSNARGNWPLFYVRDNGIGIESKNLDKIFSIFKRLHPRDRYQGGTGCGLSIVKKIIERHRGRLWLESVPGEGSTFYFSLPPDQPAC
ncbi:MAG: hypothetical protein HQK66_05975 [Desulfamplus sp.]|nr:hypothetical protein [Desulfamplus sp.]